jgi:hypothetical protein
LYLYKPEVDDGVRIACLLEQLAQVPAFIDS